VDAAQVSRDAPWPGRRRWYWAVHDDALDLHGEFARAEQVRDPALRPLLLAEGAALHRARICLAAAGWLVRVRRLPREYDDVIARLSYLGQRPPRAQDRLLYRMLASSRDRFARTALPVADLVPMLVAATANDGARLYPVPLNERALLGHDDADGGASDYFVVHGDTELAYDWLRGGEATSAAQLAAAVGGRRLRVAAAPVEAEALRAILPGHGFVYAVVSLDGRDAATTARPSDAVLTDSIWR